MRGILLITVLLALLKAGGLLHLPWLWVLFPVWGAACLVVLGLLVLTIIIVLAVFDHDH